MESMDVLVTSDTHPVKDVETTYQLTNRKRHPIGKLTVKAGEEFDVALRAWRRAFPYQIRLIGSYEI